MVAGLSGDYIRSKIGKPVAFGELVLLPSAGGVLNAVNSKDGVKVWSFSYIVAAIWVCAKRLWRI